MLSRALKYKGPADHGRTTHCTAVAYHRVAVVTGLFGKCDRFYSATPRLISDTITVLAPDHHDVAWRKRARRGLSSQLEPGTTALQDMEVHHFLAWELDDPRSFQL